MKSSCLSLLTIFQAQRRGYVCVQKIGDYRPHHRVRRVATATFWRTFHHEGKIRSVWWRWGRHAPTPFYNFCHHAPAEREDTLPLFLLYHYMHSVDPTLNTGLDEQIRNSEKIVCNVCVEKRRRLKTPPQSTQSGNGHFLAYIPS